MREVNTAPEAPAFLHAKRQVTVIQPTGVRPVSRRGTGCDGAQLHIGQPTIGMQAAVARTSYRSTSTTSGSTCSRCDGAQLHIGQPLSGFRLYSQAVTAVVRQVAPEDDRIFTRRQVALPAADTVATEGFDAQQFTLAVEGCG